MHGVPTSGSPGETLHHPDVELILNLTTPEAHASVALAALRAGKHVYNEKPLALALEATAFMVIPGHEGWHTNPAFYYQPGAGPMFDMEPYHLTALVNLPGAAGSASPLRASQFPRAHHHQSGPLRRKDQRQHAHPRQRPARVCQWRSANDHHQR